MLELLKKFDCNIDDIISVEIDDNTRYMIRNNNTIKAIPISCYGDGIRQVISIFCCLITAKDGILLIDEFDSSIHTQYMPEIVNLLINACKDLNVQLFVSTHNQEAIKSILDSAGNSLKNTRLIRMRKINNKTICKTINGQEALHNINCMGMEYRI